MAQEGRALYEKLINNVSKVIMGKDEIMTFLSISLVAGGHVLLEDVPGTGKTKMAKALAKSLDAKFARIQFTPDLLPSDITGMNVYDPKSGQFVLRKGPVFTNILLADEINRATPRTQAGLLEVMEERQVTIDGEAYVPGDMFFVIATQNPVETAGTFPLPEAQLDRFMMRLSMGFPEYKEEVRILDTYMEEDPLNSLNGVITLDELLRVRELANKVHVAPCIRDYIVRLVRATREDKQVLMGVSTRGALALLRGAKAFACLRGSDYCVPDDVKLIAESVLAHRIILGYGQSSDCKEFVRKIVEQTAVPTEDFTK